MRSSVHKQASYELALSEAVRTAAEKTEQQEQHTDSLWIKVRRERLVAVVGSTFKRVMSSKSVTV